MFETASMNPTLASLPLPMQLTAIVSGFMHWLRTHRGAVTMAGLLSFAAPVTLFTGALSVMREPTPANATLLGL